MNYLPTIEKNYVIEQFDFLKKFVDCERIAQNNRWHESKNKSQNTLENNEKLSLKHFNCLK